MAAGALRQSHRLAHRGHDGPHEKGMGFGTRQLCRAAHRGTAHRLRCGIVHNAAMVHGTETEPEARRAYEFFVDRDVQQVGFVPHPVIGMAGASPDGLVGDDGLLELKCPQTATHIDTLLTGSIPDKYLKQMQFQMACTGRAWCDFASYDNRLPERMRLYVKRVPRDDAAIADIELAIAVFLAEIDDTVTQLRARYDASLGDNLTQSLEAA
jgi:putative phage-type endonuclease